jgi:hypothetical protein
LNNFGNTADTDVGLYAASGELLAVNDDGPTDVTSLIEVPASDTSIVIDAAGGLSLATLIVGPGDYFLAIDEFDTLFAEDFDITAGLEPGETLDILLNLNGTLVESFTVTDAGPVFAKFTVVPEPTLGLAALAAAPLLLRRRRA